ncbi:Tripartite-type tricarboxylate transporter, receptor component TctC [Noviherbaspirillum humi]|uniref:Tripartite-type tricarboxylate transporter, receptor component TctC n=1 Tax=Noviherbaspirillum humi TaxID=1688639 RepID=A0A239M0H8_9BURK|nr:tripartite tricarboxylate transporter substrate binding protein [Noviherbaspirillum humi]SNT36125.1 Tripartite-type tricarboxylate transporter, receptor component TctC [Noviherbaspirillum humi]
MKTIRLLGAAALALSLFSTLAFASGVTPWPSRPLTILVPFSAGGTVDIVARSIGQKLGAELGQNVIIENRTGAGGTIATAMLAHAHADGYTLMMTHMGLAFNDALYQKPGYDTRRDILPVAYLGATPNVLVTSNSLPARTVDDFIRLAKAKPGALSYGSGGIGSAGHLPMAVLESTTGAQMVHVPYRGAAPAMTDLMSGQIQAMLQTIPAVMPFIQSGKVRAIATSGKTRSPALPNVPTLQEAGIKGFNYAPWYGLFAPAQTPEPVVARLHAAVNKVLADPEIAAKLGQQGLEVQPRSRAEFAEMVSQDITRWGGLIRTMRLQAE